MEQKKSQYDFLIVGAGLYGSVVAHELAKRGFHILVVDRRNHIGGNCYTRDSDGIHVHAYGAHIFHTPDKQIWDYMRQFGEFNGFVNSPVAVYKGRAYSLPFNMHTFSAVWGITTPEEAMARIDEQRTAITDEPRNLEEQAISLVGKDLYEMFVRGYTEKQWGRACRDLPASIIRRIPVRFTYDNSYFGNQYQGVPIDGYSKMFDKMLTGCDVQLDTDYVECRGQLCGIAKHIIFTGPIDAYYDYALGKLEYRSLRFEHIRYDGTNNMQGVAVVNHADVDVPYTRTIEHRHFTGVDLPFTIVSREYPCAMTTTSEPYYPINDDRNNSLYRKYADIAASEKDVSFGGRLGAYRYMDMQDVVSSALSYINDIDSGAMLDKIAVRSTGDNRIRVFVVQHKLVDLTSAFEDRRIYTPIQAGAAVNGRISGVFHDDSDGCADVSGYNKYINELTAHYWVYKHIDRFDTDYVGFCHYRRLLVFDHNVVGENIVLAHRRNFGARSVYTQYKSCHNAQDLNAFIHEVNAQDPELLYGIDKYLNEHGFYVCNMYVMSVANFKSMWSSFMEPCIRIAIDSINSNKIDMRGRSSNGVRAIGFILERLTGYWIWRQEHDSKVKVIDCKMQCF